MGARIINLSLAGAGYSPVLASAVAEAQAAGALVVAAAGNEGRDLTGAPSFPASLAYDNMIGVAATSQGGSLSSISNYGPGVDIAAPGEDILSTALGGGTEWRTGTSMAAPHVAGSLVLLAAARPDLDAAGLRSALVSGARPSSQPIGAGHLDAGGALRQVIAPDAWKEPAAEPVASTVKKSAKGKKAKRRVKSSRRAKGRARARARARAQARADVRRASR
jgi:subtilisin family serine protease